MYRPLRNRPNKSRINKIFERTISKVTEYSDSIFFSKCRKKRKKYYARKMSVNWPLRKKNIPESCFCPEEEIMKVYCSKKRFLQIVRDL